MAEITTEQVELRGPVNKGVIDMLDAISMARSLTRTQLVNEILGEWARLRRHELTIVSRVLRINANDSGAGGKQ